MWFGTFVLKFAFSETWSDPLSSNKKKAIEPMAVNWSVSVKVLSQLEREPDLQWNQYNISHHTLTVLLHYFRQLKSSNFQWPGVIDLVYPLTSNRHHLSYDDCLENKGRLQDCSVQYWKLSLHSVLCTHIMSSSYRSNRFVFVSLGSLHCA